MKIPFLGGAYKASSRNLSYQECVNFFFERAEDGTQNAALLGTPGTRLLTTLPNTGYGIRGSWLPSSGYAIFVQGDKVYRVTNSWNYTVCAGTLQTKTGDVCIADNGTVACIVDGIYGYFLDLTTNVITQIVNDAFYGADKVGFIDGFFIFNKPNTQQFYISSLYGTDFDGLDFASAEGSTDLLISLIVDHREVWMFGTSSTEVFYNSGNPDFPIERLQGAFIEHGCAAKNSVAKLDNTVFWVGRDNNGNGTVWRANGYTPQRISTHAIEYALQSYDEISDATAYTYQQDGHAFYVLTFPTAEKTWVYDAATQLWHERAYLDSTTGRFTRHRSNNHVFMGNTHVVGDFENGNLYALDPDYYSDNGDPLVSIRSCAVISGEGKRLVFKSLQIDMEEGVGLTTGQGVNPVVSLDWSNDHGHSWSNTLQTSFGRMGNYTRRAIFYRLGQARDRIFRVSISDPVKRVITGAYLEVTPE